MKVLVINRYKVRANVKTEIKDPVIRVSIGLYGKPQYHHSYEFNGKGRVIYNPINPLLCDATCWI